MTTHSSILDWRIHPYTFHGVAKSSAWLSNFHFHEQKDTGFISAEELMLLSCDVGEDLRVRWTARRSNQSILKEISPEYSL